MKQRRRLVFWMALLLGGVLAGLGVWLLRFGLPSNSNPSENLSRLLTPVASSTPAASATPETPLQADGSPYPRIFIPAAGVSEYIIESYLTEDGWQVDHLGNRVGHLQGSTGLGSTGNVVLAGHVETADGNPSVFAGIGSLTPGDLIQIEHRDTRIEYRVSEVKNVAQDDLSVVYPVPGSDRVTLITCTGYNFFSGSYEGRLVVVGERVN